MAVHEDSSLNATYDKDYLFKLTDDQRQDRIDERTTSIATLQTPLNLALAAYLLPHAETLEQSTAVENLNVRVQISFWTPTAPMLKWATPVKRNTLI